MKKAISIAIIALFVWCIASAIKPYWNRYRFQKNLEAAALYGTKRGMEEMRRFLDDKMKEEGRDLKGEDFIIDKDEDNGVHVSITYADEIAVFGVCLKQLKFTLEATEREVKSSF